MSPPTSVVVSSILDTDLYKLTMQQAVLRHFPDEKNSTYRFTNRDTSDVFSKRCVDEFRETVSNMASVRLTHPERTWLQQTCPYLTSEYLDYLSSYRFKPSQVNITFTPTTPEGSSSSEGEYGNIDIEVTGPWVETILWEVPLMAMLSETYFRTVCTDWTYDGQAEKAYEKAKRLIQAGCTFSEFGSRRRRSFKTQDIVCESIARAHREVKGDGKVIGTSNVLLAMKHGLMPSGTIAHEWFMGVSASKGYEHGTSIALDLWEQLYPLPLLVSLTDTFSTEVFYKSFTSTPTRASHWRGLRQDSGDPFLFAPRAKEIYQSLGVDHTEKLIVYSDGLDVEKAVRLKGCCDEVGFISSFGVGTNFTNDFKKASTMNQEGGGEGEKSKALNIVIKLASLGGKACVKISDELTKNTGDPETVREVKRMYGIKV